MVFAGWLNRQQQAAIEYLKAENEILKSQLQSRRLRLTDEERRRLAVKREGVGAEIADRVRESRDAGDDSRVAPEAGGAEMDIPPPKRWAPIDFAGGARSDFGAGSQRLPLGI